MPDQHGSIPQIASQTVKALAILTLNRSPNLPALATAHEQGVTNFAASTWNAFFLPKGTPAAIVQKLNAATVKAMETPSVQQRLKDIGATVVETERRSPEYSRNSSRAKSRNGPSLSRRVVCRRIERPAQLGAQVFTNRARLVLLEVDVEAV